MIVLRPQFVSANSIPRDARNPSPALKSLPELKNNHVFPNQDKQRVPNLSASQYEIQSCDLDLESSNAIASQKKCF